MTQAPRYAPPVLRRFLTGESGAISVDWATLTAAVTIMALLTAGLLVTGTNAFERNMTASLRADDAQAPISLGGGDDDAPAEEAVEFGFSGIGMTYATATSRVQCGSMLPHCGESADSTTHEFLMNDDSVWTRVTTTPHSGGDETIAWYDADGQPASEVPELPDDIPTVIIP